MPGAQTILEDQPLTFTGGNTISINDVDAGLSPVQVNITADKGSITLNTTNGLTFSAGDGLNDTAMIFTGSLTEINLALDGLRFIPAENYSGADAAVTIVTSDQGNSGSGGVLNDTDTVNITITPVNDAPTLDPIINLNLSSSPGPQTVNLTGISAGGGETQVLAVTATSSDTALIPSITVSYTSPATTGTLAFTPQGSGTATITVTVTDDGGTADGGVNTFLRTFTVTVASSGSDGGSSNGSTNSPTQNTIISPVMETNDDKNLNNNLVRQGTATLNLSGDADSKATLSLDVVNTLTQANMPLTIENQGVKVEFAPESLATKELKEALEDEHGVVELGAREVTLQEKENILAATPLKESTGLFEIGGKMVELTAQVTTTDSKGVSNTEKIEGFPEPVAVTIDLSNLGELSPEQIKGLTAVRFEKDDKGNIVPIKLGGTYDPVTMTFTFYTERFSFYSILRAEKLVQINLTLDIPTATVNGEGKSLDTAPAIINSRTMVPVRFVSEAFGAAVEWLAETSTVVVRLDGREFNMTLGQTGPGLDVPAQIVNGRTMVPLRYVSEALGAYVKWFPKERKIEIIK